MWDDFGFPTAVLSPKENKIPTWLLTVRGKEKRRKPKSLYFKGLEIIKLMNCEGAVWLYICTYFRFGKEPKNLNTKFKLFQTAFGPSKRRKRPSQGFLSGSLSSPNVRKESCFLCFWLSEHFFSVNLFLISKGSIKKNRGEKKLGWSMFNNFVFIDNSIILKKNVFKENAVIRFHLHKVTEVLRNKTCFYKV